TSTRCPSSSRPACAARSLPTTRRCSAPTSRPTTTQPLASGSRRKPHTRPARRERSATTRRRHVYATSAMPTTGRYPRPAMARGAAQAQRKRAQQDVKQKKKAKAAPSWEEQLFFSRLRRHAKIAYVLLAVVFAGGFVFLGVGSGSSGIGDLLQGNFFGNGGSSLSSQISDKQQAIRQHPNDVTLYLDLAGLYQTDGKEAQALATLQNAQKGAARNVHDLNRMANIYSAEAAREADRYQELLGVYSQNPAAPPGVDTSSQLGQAITSDPYTQGLQQQLNEAYTKATGAFTKVEAIYKRAAHAARATS